MKNNTGQLMDRKQIQYYISYAIRALVAVMALLVFLSYCSLEHHKKSPEEISRILEQQKTVMAAFSEGRRINDHLPDPWPPKMNKPYPEINLIDQTGQAFSLSSLKGSVIVVEFVDMASGVSQAQSGAAKKGVLGTLQKGQEISPYVLPFAEVLTANTDEKMTLPRTGIIQLKVLLYGQGADQPSRDDAQNWADHFGFTKESGVIVAVPDKDLRGKESETLIGGYQLVDKNMILRVDSVGEMPKHNLQMTLIPLVPKLLR